MRGEIAWSVARILRVVACTLPAILAGCLFGPLDPNASSTSTVGFVVDIDAAATRIGYPTQRFALRTQPYAIRDGGDTVLLASTRVVSLASVPSQRTSLMFTLDLRKCFSDPARAVSATACRLQVDVSLVLANGGLVLDHQVLGPWPIVAGIVSALDTLRLAEVGPPDVFPRSPTLAVGGTVKMVARFVTIRGDSVSRPVTWRSESPSVATVDASGMVTALSSGTANIVAIFGAGQSSNGQLIIVR